MKSGEIAKEDTASIKVSKKSLEELKKISKELNMPIIHVVDQYKLPLIMDEAADRSDSTQLANFTELVKTVTMGTEEEAKQVCLAIYETRNISPEELSAPDTYECVRLSNTEKRIQRYVLRKD